MTKSNFARKWPEFTSKATVAGNFNPSIRRRPAMDRVGAGGASFPSMRASKPRGRSELRWLENEVGVGLFAVSFHRLLE